MRLALKFASRELRSGLAGFRIFLACLALGVAAIAAAGSTAEAFRQGLAAKGREILGGDIIFTTEQRRFTQAERAAFDRAGAVVYSASGNAMAEAPGGQRRLVDLRGVDGAYPLVGEVEFTGAMSLDAALRPEDEAYGALVEPALVDRLGLKPGDRFQVGGVTLVMRGVLLSEPDRLGRGFALGPRVLTRMEAIEQSGVLAPGALFSVAARIALPSGAEPKTALAQIREAVPDSPLEARDRSEAAAGAGRLIEQLEYFLGFIGLSSLLAGGLGVAGAVGAHLESRKASIATLKVLGGEGALVRNLYLLQIAVLALLGVAIGLIIGAAAPLIVGSLMDDRLPAPAIFAIYPEPLARAAAFGLLAAAAFSLGPLARVRTTPPSALFRNELRGRLRLSFETIGAAAAGAALAVLAVLTAPNAMAAMAVTAGAAAAFGLLWLMGFGCTWLAGRLRSRSRGSVRLGLANLAGPRSAARTATPAIGLGVALLAAIVLVQSNLLMQISEVAPRAAPSVVFTEIPGDRVKAFDAVVANSMKHSGPGAYLRAPQISGRIVRLQGRPVDLDQIAREERWAFDEELVVSAVDGPAPGSKPVAGAWWPSGYEGPPLVALEVEVARAAGLEVGDTITLQILGREIEARIAVLREVDWGGFGLNFTVLLNENAVAAANPRHVAIAKASAQEEAALARALAQAFSTVNVISVREQLTRAAELFDSLSWAVRGAAGVAGAAGLLVLAGAIAAGARGRFKEAALLKVMGASRVQVLTAYLVEYGLVGAIAGAAGVVLGALAAWPMVTQVFESRFSIDWAEIGSLLALTVTIGVAAGALTALQALSGRPASALREP